MKAQSHRHWIKLVSAIVAVASMPACHQDSQSKKEIYGELEVDEVDVASRLPGRIRRILVKVGQAVKAGDILVEFEDDIMSAKKQGALATIAAAESKQAIAKDAVRPEEKQQLQAAVEAARQQMVFAKKTLDRTKELLKEGAVSQQSVDEVQFKYLAAVESYNAGLAKVKMADVGARPEERAGADALVEQARTLLAEVDAYEKDLNLKAPIDGEVFQLLNHEGELVPTGYPVVTLLRMDNPWVVVNLPETRLRDVPKDAEVGVILPALGDKEFKGSVSYVAAMGTFAMRTFTQDRATIDLKTFEVRITLGEQPEILRPGMTAIVKPRPGKIGS